MLKLFMRVACWILNATNTHTHTSCVILFAFPLQQWLHERACMLLYTYIASLLFITFSFVHDIFSSFSNLNILT
jgi:hypothetical protein